LTAKKFLEAQKLVAVATNNIIEIIFMRPPIGIMNLPSLMLLKFRCVNYATQTIGMLKHIDSAYGKVWRKAPYVSSVKWCRTAMLL
jgi:hypothetical protein